MLGDENYLTRFNKHYEAIMKYVSQGPLMVDVHMHKPLTNSRNFMDALLAFWPGLQVMKGDIKPAIETHEMLYQVMQRHKFLPEAFTTDFRIHWGQHPLRPEFVESTYFLYKATSDPYYLEVGKSVLDNLEKHAKVRCGYAAIKDVTTGIHEDQMDSYVLAETFKYLYLLFSENEDLMLDVDDYVFTTEAHLLPLSLSLTNSSSTSKTFIGSNEDEHSTLRNCPNTNYLLPGNSNYAHTVRSPLKNIVANSCPKSRSKRKPRLRAGEFIAGNKPQLEQLRRMGIRIVTMSDGRIQLLHTASDASTPDDAEDGLVFMQEMIELSKSQQMEASQEPRVVQLVSSPFFGSIVLNAGPAQFGPDLKVTGGLTGLVSKADSFRACVPLENPDDVKGKIAVIERGDCMFIDKARHLQAAGAIGGVVVDNNEGSTSDTAPLFAMSGDGKEDVSIPLVFLFHKEGVKLQEYMELHSDLGIYLGYKSRKSDEIMREMLVTNRETGSNTAEQDSTVEADASTSTGASTGASGNDGSTTKDWSKDAELLLQIIEGKKAVSDVSLDQFVSSDQREMGYVYTELINMLQDETNFLTLNSVDKTSYSSVIGELVEVVFSDGTRKLTEDSQHVLGKLSSALKANNAQSAEHYATEEELTGGLADPQDSSGYIRDSKERHFKIRNTYERTDMGSEEGSPPSARLSPASQATSSSRSATSSDSCSSPSGASQDNQEPSCSAGSSSSTSEKPADKYRQGDTAQSTGPSSTASHDTHRTTQSASQQSDDTAGQSTASPTQPNTEQPHDKVDANQVP